MGSSSLRRWYLYYLHNIRRSHVLVLVAILAAAYLWFGPKLFSRSGKSPYGAVRYRYEKEPEKMDTARIQRTLGSLVDTRPVKCRDHAYEFARLDGAETVSIITEFHGSSFYDLKLTLAAITEHTPYDLYTEIIVLDDGTKEEKIREQAAAFLRDPKYNKVKVYRSESHDGQSATWFKAAVAAKGSILVFVDSSVIVNHGWIQPLIAKVLDEPNLIAVPHADNLLDDDRFFRTEDYLVNVFTWMLSTVYFESNANADDTIDTPVTRGDVIAVRRVFLESIGSFDDQMHAESGGGHHVELSLRAWMCGGVVRIITCSRIAVRNSLRPRKITSTANYRRITELWFDELRNVIYRQGEVISHMSQEESQSLSNRRAFLRKTLSSECKPFHWYLTNVATPVIAPSDGARSFGKLRAKTNYCIHSATNGAVSMALCREYMYEPHAIFEMNSDGAIFRGDQCLEPEEGGQIVFSKCSEGNANQRWVLADKRLKLASNPHRCLTQVSERDSNTLDLYHYARLKPCADQDGNQQEPDLRKQTWKFLNY